MSARQLPTQLAVLTLQPSDVESAIDDKDDPPGVLLQVGRANRGRRFRLTPGYETVARDMLFLPESAIILSAAYACRVIFDRYGSPDWSSITDVSLASIAVLAAASWPSLMRGSRSEQSPDGTLPSAPIVGLALCVAVLFGLLAAVGALAGLTAGVPKAFFPAWAALSLIALLLARALFAAHLRILRRSGVLRERVGIVRCGGERDLTSVYLRDAVRANIEVVGVFHDAADGQTNHPAVNDLVALAMHRPIDRVVIVTDRISSDRLATIMQSLKALDVDVTLWVAAPGHDAGGVAGLVELPLIRRPLREWGRAIKMAQDRLIALLALPPALIIMAVIAAAIRLDTRGPILFSQARHGRNNSEFQVLKFRTMEWLGESHGSGAQQTRRNDMRVTRVGRILRRTSLDELPQLFNVLRGDMSIVGPRPHPVAMRTEDRLGHEITPEYPHRHRVKPGLTGLAQINGCRGATESVEQVRSRVTYDNRYIDSWSMSLDLKILALTPLKLVLHGGKAF
jgi:exopolysaccharide biosynthesis polyprenyl glycosylphosphotransferase